MEWALCIARADVHTLTQSLLIVLVVLDLGVVRVSNLCRIAVKFCA